jgi:hypothetical protein
LHYKDGQRFLATREAKAATSRRSRYVDPRWCAVKHGFPSLGGRFYLLQACSGVQERSPCHILNGTRNGDTDGRRCTEPKSSWQAEFRLDAQLRRTESAEQRLERTPDLALARSALVVAHAETGVGTGTSHGSCTLGKSRD